MTIADDQLARLLAAVLELDTPRPGEDAAAMVQRVARELHEHRRTEQRHYGITTAAAMRGERA